MSKDEHVLCCSRAALESARLLVPFFEGGSSPHLLGINETMEQGRALDSLRFEFIPRSKCETNPNYKQLIPYVEINVVPIGPGDTEPGGGMLALTYRRAGQEGRLHGLISLGIGGHILPTDEPVQPSRLLEWARQAAYREILEEVGPLSQVSLSSLKLSGLVNSDGNDVGRVHLGLVYRVCLEVPPADWLVAGLRWDDPQLRAAIYPEGCQNFGDGELTGATLLSMSDLASVPEQEFEPWSQMLLPLARLSST